MRRKHIGESELLYIIRKRGAAAFGVSPEGAALFYATAFCTRTCRGSVVRYHVLCVLGAYHPALGRYVRGLSDYARIDAFAEHGTC